MNKKRESPDEEFEYQGRKKSDYETSAIIVTGSIVALLLIVAGLIIAKICGL